MSLDFVNDMLASLNKQGLQYHLVVLDPNGDGGGNIHTFDNLEIEEYPIVLETLGESIENLGAQYEDFIKWMEKEMRKEQKGAKKIKGSIEPNV